MLRTRLPLLINCIATTNKPFDLHVLTTPPAFILSQDQTLRKREFNKPSDSLNYCYRSTNDRHVLYFILYRVLIGGPNQSHKVNFKDLVLFFALFIEPSVASPRRLFQGRRVSSQTFYQTRVNNFLNYFLDFSDRR